MPWKVKDVDKHKKGLTPSQKKKWVSIANKVLRECLDGGGSKKSCEAKAIRVANSKFTEEGGDSMPKKKMKVPAGAMHLLEGGDVAVQFKQGDGGEKPVVSMKAYSGRPFKHWFWGNFAIRLSGMKFPKSKYPLLRDHRTNLELGFFGKPLVEDSKGIDLNPDSVKLLENDEAQKFLENSRDGFPYEASIYAQPTSIKWLNEGEEDEVNGHKLQGPGAIWETSIFKEASVCVFGADPNTKTGAFSEEVELDIEAFMKEKETDEEVEEDMPITLEQFKKDSPEEFKKLQEEVKASVASEFESKLQEEKDKVAALESQNEALKSSEEKLSDKVLSLEKRELQRTEREQKSKADALFSQKLAASDIPERLHKKVQSMVSYSKFVGEDGRLDIEAFSEAVDSEISDWTESLGEEVILGTTRSLKGPDGGSDKNEFTAEATVERMAGYIGIPATKEQ